MCYSQLEAYCQTIKFVYVNEPQQNPRRETGTRLPIKAPLSKLLFAGQRRFVSIVSVHPFLFAFDVFVISSRPVLRLIKFF